MSNTGLEALENILTFIEESTFKCSVCGVKVYPKITDVDVKKHEISIDNESYSLTGGIGNAKVLDNVCFTCCRNMGGI